MSLAFLAGRMLNILCASLDELLNYYWLPPDVLERQREQGTRDF